jgi:hypothetical protein
LTTRYEPEVLKYLHTMDDRQLTCLAQTHGWPKLDPRKKVPNNFAFIPTQGGIYQVRETCDTCTSVRESTTLPGGIFDPDLHRVYSYPHWWLVRPVGSELTKRDFTAELYRRMIEDLK